MKIIALTVLLALSFFARAQFEDGDFTVGFSGNAVVHSDYGTKAAFGLNMQVFLSDNFSLNSNFHFAPNYVHMPIGTALTALLLLSGDPAGCSNVSCNDDDYWAVVLLILFTEGASLHVPLGQSATISPYLNPLGVDYWYMPEKPDEMPFLFTFGAGMKFNLILGENAFFAPFAEYRTIYGQGQPGFGGGLSLNIIIR